ncbi:hypothetical protein TNCV_5036591 [Trichonephila clavipes]|nr:hypothetical protein TNCV_5036591 [Trichonephila clavipes]
MISILKAHCHPPINDRSIANASCTAIGPPPLKSRPSLQAQFSKTMKIRVSQIEDRRMLTHSRFLFTKSSVKSSVKEVMIHFSARLHSTFANHLIDLQSYGMVIINISSLPSFMCLLFA